MLILIGRVIVHEALWGNMSFILFRTNLCMCSFVLIHTRISISLFLILQLYVKSQNIIDWRVREAINKKKVPNFGHYGLIQLFVQCTDVHHIVSFDLFITDYTQTTCSSIKWSSRDDCPGVLIIHQLLDQWTGHCKLTVIKCNIFLNKYIAQTPASSNPAKLNQWFSL